MSVQNLSKASDLSKRKQDNSYQLKYLLQKLVHQSDVSDKLMLFPNISLKIGLSTKLL